MTFMIKKIWAVCAMLTLIQSVQARYLITGAMFWMLLSTNCTWAIEIQPQFNHLTRTDGLSHPWVNAITQDQQGYLWFATDDGLNRYDGYELKVYRHQSKNAASIDDSTIISLLVDHRGRLWVGTLQGLNRYIPASDSFAHYSFDNHQAIRVFSLYEDSDHNILVGSNGAGIFAVDEQRQTLKKFSLTNHDFLKQKKIKIMLEYHSNLLLIGTDDGLFILNQQTSEVSEHRFGYVGGKTRFSNDITSLYVHENENEKVFVGSLDGLHIFDVNTKQFSTLVKSNLDDESIADNAIESLYGIDNNKIWVATQGGINILDAGTQRSRRIRHIKNEAHSLSSNNVSTLFRDDTGIIWIGTKDAGVNRYDPKTQAFGLTKLSSGINSCSLNDRHHNILKSRSGNLWLDVYKQGIYRINITTGSCQSYSNITQALQRHNDSISPGSLFEDSRGAIWLGTANGDIYRLNKGGKVFKRFLGKNEETLTPGALRQIVEDPQGNLWMAFDNGGVRFLNHKTEQYKQFIVDATNSNSISSNYVFTLALGKDVLWIGSETGGVDRYDINSKTFRHYGHQSGHPNGFRNGVYSLLNDPLGYLWAGTMSMGLARIDKKTHEIRYFTSDHGLPNNTIYKVLMDNQGVLWLATNNGLARFDPQTNISTNFYASDGLQGNDFNTGGFFDRQNNQLIFVGDKGINMFNPLDILPDQSKARTVITDFLLSNQHKGELLNTGDDNQQHITLNYRQNIFSFAFAGLHFADPERQQYRFKMQGFDNEWRKTDDRHRIATYTNLDPGHYKFRVKASNHQGVWGDETSVTLSITPPLWLTWWAKLLYVLLTLMLLAGLYCYRTRAMRMRTKLLESTVASRTQELSKEKQRVEALLAHKAKEFENISHEFRTPLAIIIGRAEQQLKEPLSAEQKNAFALIGNIGQRLALTVDNVIEMARFQQTEPAEHFQLISISTLVSELCQQMAAYARLKQQTFSTDITQDIFQYCQPKAIEKLVNNLVSNAIKYTQEGGDIVVGLSTVGSAEYQFFVKDNGIGIPTAEQAQIFERFYRCPKGNNLSVSGTGIGLSLVQDVVELHHGKIELMSEPDQGSCFTITLPRNVHRQDPSDYLINARHIDIMMAEKAIEENNRLSKTLAHGSLPMLLLVEDNADMRRLLQEQLKNHYHIVSAKNGVEGLKLALDTVPEVIVSDINMPLMDGYELLNKVKNHPATSHIPMILLTAKSDAQSRVTGFKYKADGYIGKPYSLDELMALLEAQRHNRHRVREYVIKVMANKQSVDETGLDEYSNEVINKCMAHVRQHYQNAALSMQDLIDVACLSERQLQRKFQETMAMSPSEFINDYRLQCAQPLIRQSVKVSDVAFRVGFSSANYFSRQYKKKYGISPSQDTTAPVVTT